MAMTIISRPVASSLIVRARAIVLIGLAPQPSGGRLIQVRKNSPRRPFGGRRAQVLLVGSGGNHGRKKRKAAGMRKSRTSRRITKVPASCRSGE